MSETVRLYGVSSGNGNDGVSHTFADYYVKTSEPWRLAKLAAVSEFKPEWQDWASEHLEIDGEAEYTISAVIYNPPEDEERYAEHEESGTEDEFESYSDYNGAWRIWEVFPEDEPREGRPIYESIEEAFSEDIVKKYPEND